MIQGGGAKRFKIGNFIHGECISVRKKMSDGESDSPRIYIESAGKSER